MAHEVNHIERDVAAHVRTVLMSRISRERLELWIPTDTTWDFQQGILTLAFQTDFACQLCRKMLLHEIAGALREVVGATNQEIHFAVRSSSSMSRSESNHSGVAEFQPTMDPPECAGTAIDEQALRPRGSSGRSVTGNLPDPVALIDSADNAPLPTSRSSSSFQAGLGGDRASSLSSAVPQSLWGTVIAGQSNQLAWTAANLVITAPGRLTPVLIHGPTGTGKSLIVSALAQRMRSDLRMRRVVHMTSEQFTNDFTESLHGGGLPMFRRKYRDVDALLLDDIHFLAGKKSTLAEVRHTVDNLLRFGKQVVLSADRPLSELTALGEELLVRLRGGLVTPLFPLDEAIRFSLLKQLTAVAKLEIDDEILQQLCSRVAGDGRLIRGLVHRLTAVSSLHPGKLPWEKCWTAVIDLVQATQPVVRMVDIERVVCGIFGLEPSSLQSKSKIRSVSQPRMLAMFLARKYTPAAYKEIGDYFGQRRHSTVISAEKTVAAWLSGNTQLEGMRHLSARDAIRHAEAQLQVG